MRCKKQINQILMSIVNSSIELPISVHSYKIWFAYHMFSFLYDLISLMLNWSSTSKSQIATWAVVDALYIVTIVVYITLLKRLPGTTYVIGILSYYQLAYYFIEPTMFSSKDINLLFANVVFSSVVASALFYCAMSTILESAILGALHYIMCVFVIYNREEYQLLTQYISCVTKTLLYSTLIGILIDSSLLYERTERKKERLLKSKITSSLKKIMNSIDLMISIESCKSIKFRNYGCLNLVPYSSMIMEFLSKYKSSDPNVYNIADNVVVNVSQKDIFFENENCTIYLLHDMSNIRKKEEAKFTQLLLATITHELRAPLNIISHFLNALLDGETDSIKKEYLEKSLMASAMQECLINDILDVAKLNNGTLSFYSQPSDVRKLLSELYNIYKWKVTSSIKLSLNVDNSLPDLLVVDERRIRQIIMNLISNSIKFTISGFISIDAHYSKEYLYCSVSDSGVGIDENEFSKVFKQFGMLDSNRTMNPTGTGLGLNLCKKLLLAMNGDIAFKSNKNVCTIFTFWVPCTPKLCSCSKLINSISFKEKAVLNIDDDNLNLCVLDNYANKYGIVHYSFTHPSDALERVIHSNLKFSLAFIDINMPEMSGYDVARTIRSAKTKCVLLALTGEDKQNIHEQCKKAGFDDVVEKPMRYEEYCSYIDKYHAE